MRHLQGEPHQLPGTRTPLAGYVGRHVAFAADQAVAAHAVVSAAVAADRMAAGAANLWAIYCRDRRRIPPTESGLGRKISDG